MEKKTLLELINRLQRADIGSLLVDLDELKDSQGSMSKNYENLKKVRRHIEAAKKIAVKMTK